MGRRNTAMLVALSLIWGASFLFIKVAVRDLAPSSLILGRLGLAAITLAAIAGVVLGRERTLRDLRENLLWIAVVGIVNTAVPFWLLSWGETRIQSGLASILQAAVPIFNAVIAFGFFRDVRVTGIRLAGVGLGFLGVALLVGAQPEGKVLGALAVVGMALCYGLGGLLAGRHLSGVQPVVVALGSTAVSALAAAPAGAAQAVGASVGWRALGSVAILGVLGTAVAYLLFFALVRGAGAAYASLVTYLCPPIALVYGALFLGERFGAAAFGGLALILAGVALGSGVVGLARVRRGIPSEA